MSRVCSAFLHYAQLPKYFLFRFSVQIFSVQIFCPNIFCPDPSVKSMLSFFPSSSAPQIYSIKISPQIFSVQIRVWRVCPAVAPLPNFLLQGGLQSNLTPKKRESSWTNVGARLDLCPTVKLSSDLKSKNSQKEIQKIWNKSKICGRNPRKSMKIYEEYYEILWIYKKIYAQQ